MTDENKNKSGKETRFKKRIKKIKNEIRAAEALSKGDKPSDFQASMKFVQDKDLTGKNVPGGVNKGGKIMKPITMNMGGQVEGVEDLTTEFEVTD